MKKKITIYLIVIVTLINLSSLGTILYLKLSSISDMSLNVMQDNRFEMMKRELELTPEQLEHFEIIRTEFHSRLDSLDTKFSLLRKDMLSEIWRTKVPDKQKIETILEQFSKQQLEAQRWTVQHFYKFKEVLTPRQAEKFYRIVSERFPGQHRNPSLRRMIDKQEDCE